MAPQLSCTQRFINFFGGAETRGAMSECARRLGIQLGNIRWWLKQGYIASGYEFEIEKITNGEIRAMEIVAERNANKKSKAKRYVMVEG